MIDITSPKISAQPKFLTLNPSTIASTKIMSAALITHTNNPKVMMVMGRLKISKMGFIKTLIKASKAATKTALQKFLISTPLSKLAVA